MATSIHNQQSTENEDDPYKNSELSSEFSSRIYKYFGRPIPGKTTFVFTLLLLVNTFVIIQMILSLILQWDNFAIRSKAIENLNLAYLSVFTFAELVFCPGNLEMLIKTVNGPIFKYNYQLSEKQKKLKSAAIIKDKSTLKRFNALLTYYYIAVHLLPCVYSVLKIVFTDIKGCCKEAYYDLVFSMPLTNIFIYVLVLIIQNIYSAALCLAYLCWTILLVCSLLHIGEEIEVLCLFLNELDDRLKLSNNDIYQRISGNDRQKGNLNAISSDEEIALKVYLKEIVQHHQAIIQSVKNVNRSASSSMFMYNQFCCIELCINLYLGFAITDARRYTYFTTLLIVMTLVGMIGNIGQKLSNKGEKLNQAIHECSWINKPRWFQKSIIFMTMYASKPLQLKPVGLFVVNLANTAKIGQAAYSYFNLLRSFKEQT